MPKTNHKRRFAKKISVQPKAPGGGVPKFAFPDQPEVARVWDASKTLKENYEEIGLVLDVNKIIATTVREKEEEKFAKLHGITKPKTKPKKKKDLLVVDEEAAPFERQVSDSIGAYYERLMKKYGTDYASSPASPHLPKAMARDHKLNTWQHTKRKLQKECERLIAQRQRQSSQE